MTTWIRKTEKLFDGIYNNNLIIAGGMKMKAKKILAMALAVGMTLGLTGVPTFADDKKTFVFGDTTFNAENEEADINPQKQTGPVQRKVPPEGRNCHTKY